MEWEKQLDHNLDFIQRLPCACCIVQNDSCLSLLQCNQNMCNLLGFQESNEYDDLECLLSKEDFTHLKDTITISHNKCIDQFKFTSGYLLNQQLFHFAYEGKFIEDEKIIFTISDVTQYRDIEKELHYIQQQHNIMMERTGYVITQYDISTRTLYQPKRAANKFGLPCCLENVPYSTVDKLIAEESKEDYIQFYLSIMNGNPHHEMTIRAHDVNHVYAWYFMQYDLIYDEDHLPARAIISYKDITDLQEKELAYKKWQNYFQSQQEKSIAYYEYNLTKDYFVIMEVEPLELPFKGDNLSFFELTSYISQHYILQEDREEYVKLFSRGTLLAEFYAGEREYRFEHRRIRKDGSVYWALAIIQLVSDPYTNDIMASILIEDINEEKESLFHLRHLSRIDPLTGLLNRSTMIHEVDELFQNGSVEDSHVLLMIDLDEFKYLNDHLGHKFGDQVLLNVAKELRRTVRAGDLCARLGGDEFVVLMKYTTIDESLLQRVQALHNGINWVYGSIQTSTSIGLSTFPNDGWSFDDLYQKADVALYKAKRNGRNQFVVYSSYEEEK